MLLMSSENVKQDGKPYYGPTATMFKSKATYFHHPHINRTAEPKVIVHLHMLSLECSFSLSLEHCIMFLAMILALCTLHSVHGKG